MKVRKKPVVVDAERWYKHGDNPYVENFIHFIAMWDREKHCEHCAKPLSEHGRVKTLEGGHIVCPGDWIITGVEGEMYPCKPNIFDKTYEIVEE